jgi:hypothetical protein
MPRYAYYNKLSDEDEDNVQYFAMKSIELSTVKISDI